MATNPLLALFQAQAGIQNSGMSPQEASVYIPQVLPQLAPLFQSAATPAASAPKPQMQLPAAATVQAPRFEHIPFPSGKGATPGATPQQFAPPTQQTGRQIASAASPWANMLYGATGK
jgi:hypothetical protein